MALNSWQISDRDYFFGRGRYNNKANGFLTYESLHTADEIIVQTDHVVSILDEKKNAVQYLLLIAANKAIYLDYHRQVRKITYYPDGKPKRSYLVKLFRYKFKPYYCKKFPGHELVSEVSFDGLYDEAKIQGAKKMKVRIN